MQSHDYKTLSPEYRDVLRRDIGRLLALNDGAIARLPFSLVLQKHIAVQIDGMSVNPANTRLKVWRKLSAFARNAGIVTTLPTDGLRQVTPKSGDGHIPWSFAEIETYRAHWRYGTMERLAFELHYWIGARIGDTVRLGPNNVDDAGWLVFIQSKTNVEVSVPFDRALPHFAVAADLDHLRRAIAAMGPIDGTFLETAYGLPRSPKGACQWFSGKAREAGVPAGRTSHGLRKSRMIQHAERGASMKQIAAWSGHESLKEIARYVRRADKRRMLSAGPPPPEASVLTSGDFL